MRMAIVTANNFLYAILNMCGSGSLGKEFQLSSIYDVLYNNTTVYSCISEGGKALARKKRLLLVAQHALMWPLYSASNVLNTSKPSWPCIQRHSSPLAACLPLACLVSQPNPQLNFRLRTTAIANFKMLSNWSLHHACHLLGAFHFFSSSL